MKRPLLILFLFLFFVGCEQKTTVQEDKTADDEFSFAFLTDIHLQPELNAVEGFKQAIDTVNKLNPD